MQPHISLNHIVQHESQESWLSRCSLRPAASNTQKLVSHANSQPDPRPAKTMGAGHRKFSRALQLGIPALEQFPFPGSCIDRSSNLSPQAHLSPSKDHSRLLLSPRLTNPLIYTLHPTVHVKTCSELWTLPAIKDSVLKDQTDK